MTITISLKDLKQPPVVGDQIDVEDERVFEGAPCSGHVVFSDGKWIVLMRGDTDECRCFGFYALKAVHRWRKNDQKWWRLQHTGMGNI